VENINNKITIGSLVKLKSKKTNSTYRVRKFFKNHSGKLWAECLNMETDEVPEHPVEDLEICE
jgi:hypothetical protein